MANTVLQDNQGPDWPLGNIVVVTPGTPVNIMSLVDPGNTNAPETATTTSSKEYTPLCQQIQFQAFNGGGSTRLTPNTGNIYIVRKNVGAGTGGTTDLGIIVAVLAPGQTYFMASSARNRDTFSPYRYYIDADSASDGAQVTLIIQ